MATKQIYSSSSIIHSCKAILALLLYLLVPVNPLLADEVDDLKAQAVAKIVVDEWKQAETLYTEILKTAPDDIVSYLNRALCRQRLGNSAGAKEDGEHVLSLLKQQGKFDSNETKYLVYKANAYRRSGNYTTAITLIKRAINLNPDYSPLKAILRNTKNESILSGLRN